MIDEVTTPVESQDESPSAPAGGEFSTTPMRTVGYHFGPLSFVVGQGGVQDIYVGDPGIPGIVAVKVLFKGTGKKSRVFMVPSNLMILEQEETPILLPKKPQLVVAK